MKLYENKGLNFPARREARLAFLKNALKTEFKKEDFDPECLGITRDMSEALNGKRYPAPKRYPTFGEHPRIIFNKTQYGAILEVMNDPEYHFQIEKLVSVANEDMDGRLGKRRTDFGKKGEHNYDYTVLENMTTKAFAYVITGEEVYGLEAIYMLENLIRTLDIYWMYSDQCREFGFVMFTAACIFDWCHDLLTDDDKFRIIAGIEHRICRGEVEGKHCIGPSSWGYKMEIGFPPHKQGYMVGHGSEHQLLRDYLSFSLAIYDEYPEWYEFVGGRFFDEYIEPRNYYYSAGIFPQGTGGYNFGRFSSDLYSAVIMKSATGEIPYDTDSMKKVLYGLISALLDPEERSVMFRVGDARVGCSVRSGVVPLLSGYLFNDPIALAIYKWYTEDFTKLTGGYDSIGPAFFFVFMSSGAKVEKNLFEKLPLVNYHGGWYGATLVRDKFNKDCAASLMKIHARNAANHDHAAAGTFQIYYKELLTGDSGDYCGVAYGMPHCQFFARSTVAHNGLLIYNPEIRDYEKKFDEKGKLINGQRYYYCGAQRRDYGEPQSLDAWQSDLYKGGDIISHKELLDSDGKPEFAYLEGEIAPSYPDGCVNSVKRAMLTVFSGEESSPMTFFVADRIDAKKPEFKKTFLLQVPVANAPVIDADSGKVAIFGRESKLLLTNLDKNINFKALGGSDDSVEDEAFRRRNYLINGEQMHFYLTNPGVTPADGDSWGRVELSTCGERVSHFTNVIQVGDIDKELSKVNKISAYATSGEELLRGALVEKTAVLFSNGEGLLRESFSLVLDTDATVYIAGVDSGAWRVGDLEYIVNCGEGIIRASLKAGKYQFVLK